MRFNSRVRWASVSGRCSTIPDLPQPLPARGEEVYLRLAELGQGLAGFTTCSARALVAGVLLPVAPWRALGKRPTARVAMTAKFTTLSLRCPARANPL